MQRLLSLIELDRMGVDEAQRLPFEVREGLLDLILQDGRKLLGPQIERQAGLFSDYFEEDLSRLQKVRAVRVRCSGFIPINPDGEVPTLEVKGQCRVVFENMKGALAKMGTSLDRVVNLIIFLKNMDYWGEMNAVYREYFKSPPTRATIGTVSLNKTYQIEVANVIAYKVQRG
jgi:2-iminobutanoate/2-iminopropanoate deaminase